MIANDEKQLEMKLREMGFVANDGPIGFPKIVVVGGAKVGKSSLIESLVRREIFPKDMRVTKRPVVIEVEANEVGKPDFVQFEGPNHVQGAKLDATNSALIADEIKKGMQEDDGNFTPINLRISVAQVTDEMTFVDLPAYTKFADATGGYFVGNKSSDSTLVLNDCEQFLDDQVNLIMAVVAANDMDGFNSTIEYVRRFDPEGNRIIGVVTMLDLTPATDELKEILANRKSPLQRGYYGVVNRSAEDLKRGRKFDEALEAERRFFSENPIYKSLPNRMGSDHLEQYLKRIMYKCRKVVLSNIQAQMEVEAASFTSECDSAASNTDCSAVACCLPCPPGTVPCLLKRDDDDGLTVEILFEGLGGLCAPTIECGTMAIEGPDYQVCVSSPGAKRKLILSADECKRLHPSSQARRAIKIRKGTPWENVETETFGQSAAAAHSPKEWSKVTSDARVSAGAVSSPMSRITETSEEPITDYYVHEQSDVTTGVPQETATSDSLSSIYWKASSSTSVISTTSVRSTTTISSVTPLSRTSATTSVSSVSQPKDYEDLVEANLVNVFDDTYRVPESADDLQLDDQLELYDLTTPGSPSSSSLSSPSSSKSELVKEAGIKYVSSSVEEISLSSFQSSSKSSFKSDLGTERDVEAVAFDENNEVCGPGQPRIKLDIIQEFRWTFCDVPEGGQLCDDGGGGGVRNEITNKESAPVSATSSSSASYSSVSSRLGD